MRRSVSVLAGLCFLMGASCSAWAQANVSGHYTLSGSTTDVSGPLSGQVPQTWNGSEDLSQPTGGTDIFGSGTLNTQTINETGFVSGGVIRLFIGGFSIGTTPANIELDGTMSTLGTVEGTMTGRTFDGLTTWTGTFMKGPPIIAECLPTGDVPDCVCKILNLSRQVAFRDTILLRLSLTAGTGEHNWEVILSRTDRLQFVGQPDALRVGGKLKCGNSIQIPLIASNNDNFGPTHVTAILDNKTVIDKDVFVFLLVPDIVAMTTESPSTVVRPAEVSKTALRDTEKRGDFSVKSESYDLQSTAVATGGQEDHMLTVVAFEFDVKIEAFDVSDRCVPATIAADVVLSDTASSVTQVVPQDGSVATHKVSVQSRFFGFPYGTLTLGPVNRVVTGGTPEKTTFGVSVLNPQATTKKAQLEPEHIYVVYVVVSETADAMRAKCRCDANGVNCTFSMTPICPDGH